MDAVRKAFFRLLQSGLWGESHIDRTLFPLSSEDWERLYVLSVRHTVTGLVYCGLSFLDEDMMPPEALLFRWTAAVDKIERRNVQMRDVSDEMVASGIRPVFVKGLGLAALYDNPLLRESGDIDMCLVRQGDYDKLMEMLKAGNVNVCFKPDGSLSFMWKGVPVEVHKELVDLHNPFRKKYLRRLERECLELVQVDIGRDNCLLFPDEKLNMLLVNAHIMRHAFGRGVGLRQICDLAMLYRSVKGRYEAENIKSMYTEAGISGWSRILHPFMTEYLAMPAGLLPYEDKRVSSDGLFDIVMGGGNFGHYAGPEGLEMKPDGKAGTLKAFVRRFPFAVKAAPGEAFWLFFSLVAGQFRRKGI